MAKKKTNKPEIDYLGSTLSGATNLFAREIEYGKGKNKKSFTAYSVGVSKKDEDGEYINAYVDVFLSKSATKALNDMEENETSGDAVYYEINVISGWFTVRESNNDDYPNKIAFFFNEVEERDA